MCSRRRFGLSKCLVTLLSVVQEFAVLIEAEFEALEGLDFGVHVSPDRKGVNEFAHFFVRAGFDHEADFTSAGNAALKVTDGSLPAITSNTFSTVIVRRKYS